MTISYTSCTNLTIVMVTVTYRAVTTILVIHQPFEFGQQEKWLVSAKVEAGCQ